MKKGLVMSVVMGVVAALTSCSTSSVNETVASASVRLDQANYRVVATQVKGSSVGFHLATALPTNMSDLSAALQGGPLGGFPVKSASEARAVEELYQNIGDQRNRAMALINIRKEVSGLNLILFSFPKVTVSADVIEFTH